MQVDDFESLLEGVLTVSLLDFTVISRMEEMCHLMNKLPSFFICV